MKYLSVLLFLFVTNLTFGQITKLTGIAYTNGAPSFTPTDKGAEFAIDTSNSYIYQYHRTTSTWLRLGQGIDVISGGVSPAYTPTRNMSRFAINASDELYYYNGSAWNQLNAGGSDGNGIYDGSGYYPLYTYARLADTTANTGDAPDLIIGRGDWLNASYNGTDPLCGLIIDDPNSTNSWYGGNAIVTTDTTVDAVTEFYGSGTSIYLFSGRNYGATNRTAQILVGATSGISNIVGRISPAGTSNVTDVFKSDTTFGFYIRHLRGMTSTPGLVVGANAGTGASVAITSAESSDLAGRFTVTTGTGAATGLWATATFAESYKVTPTVVFQAEDDDASGISVFATVTTGGFTINVDSGASVTDATTYNWSYQVITGK